MDGYRLAPETYLQSLSKESERLADAAEPALFEEVPTCPGWDVHQLVGHVGRIHRRTIALVELDPPGPVDADSLPEPPPGAQRVKWFREGARELVDVLRGAGPDRPCWTPERPVGTTGFWFRRLAQETTMHRVDVELASSEASAISAEIGADGIDELFGTHLPRRLSRGRMPALVGIVHFEADDLPASWTVRLAPERVTIEPEIEAATEVRGHAGDLLRYLWNRGDSSELTISGNTEIITDWAHIVRI